MRDLFAVGIGSFIGGVTRYVVGGWLQASVRTTFPVGTLFVNTTGCLLIGLIGGAIERSVGLSETARLFVVTGFLGGYTTFSAFSYESVGLARAGACGMGFANIALSLLLGLAATLLGLTIVRSM